jgi:hypothetical protein
MQEVNFKNFTILNLFYLHFCFMPHICIQNSSLRIFGVVTWHCSVKNTILLHTHKHIILLPHFTNNFSLLTTHISHATFWPCHCHGPRQSSLCWVLFVCTNLHHHFQDIIHEDESRIFIWNLINCHIIRACSLYTWFVNFVAKTFVFLGYVLSEDVPSFEQNNNFIYNQMFRRAVKFWKCLV